MKTNINFLSYLTQFFLERELFHSKVVKKIKTHILCSVTFFENCAIMRCGAILYSRAGHGQQYDACALHTG